MDLKKIIKDQQFTLVDVREPLELFMGKIKTATNIPLRNVASKVEEFKKMTPPIILFCRSGQRSGKAMEYLKAQGIEEVYNGGGLSDVRDLLE